MKIKMPSVYSWVIPSLVISICNICVCQYDNGEHSHVQDDAAFQAQQATAIQWLSVYNRDAGRVHSDVEKARWTYYTNMTKHNEDELLNYLLRKAGFERSQARHALSWDWRKFHDVAVRRQLEKITSIGFSALNSRSKYERLQTVLLDINKIYPSISVCPTENTCLHGYTEVDQHIKDTRNVSDLEQTWQALHVKTGSSVRSLYTEYVSLSNEAYSQLGYQDTGEFWRADSESIPFDLDQLWLDVKPLYELLHTFVRYELKRFYGNSRKSFSTSGHIPAHLLGSSVGADWLGLHDVTRPYPGVANIDITTSLEGQRYNGTSLAQKVNSYFSSMGFDHLPASFWSVSMFDSNAASLTTDLSNAVFDFDRNDTRVHWRMVPGNDAYLDLFKLLSRVHFNKEAGNQSFVFRQEPFPGYIAAIGEALSLSAFTPVALRRSGLLEVISNDKKSEINYLLLMALRTFPLLSYAYLADHWSWGVFNGATPTHSYTDHWWQLRCRHQGVSPPAPRSASDFDSGADPHLMSEIPYFSTFISKILQFQVHKSLCKTSNHSGPIHNCDLQGSTTAGGLLKSQLRFGGSRPIPEVLESLTGQRSVSSSPLMEYFKPLHTWLQSEVSSYRQRDSQLWSEECPFGVTSGSDTSHSEYIAFLLLISQFFLNCLQ